MTNATDTAGHPTAVDNCEPWCIAEPSGHREYTDPHASRPRGVDLPGSGGRYFVQLSRPYVGGLPLEEARDRHVDVTVALGDDAPTLRLLPSEARSLAAALTAMAELAEDPFRVAAAGRG